MRVIRIVRQTYDVNVPVPMHKLHVLFLEYGQPTLQDPGVYFSEFKQVKR